MDTQFVSGTVRLVLVNTSYCCPEVPFVPLITKLVPEKLMLVMCGCGTTLETTLNTPLAGLKFHTNPTPGEPAMLAKLPVTLPALNNWKLSPATKEPTSMLVGVSVPP